MIKKAFSETFGKGKVYIFGSRTDDTKRGGDIDLYLCPEQDYKDTFQRKLIFLVKLEKYIGDQKIDVVLTKDQNRLIEQVAMRDGVELKV
jgi:predicted nucleotidyltransferase